MAHVAKMPFARVARVTFPFIIPIAVVLLLLIFFPGLVTTLPNLLIS